MSSAKQRLTLTNLTEPQQMRELNRQLTWIWDQLLGGLSMKSLNEGTRAIIDSKAENDTVMSLIRQTDEKVELAVSRKVGGTNLIGCADGKIWVQTGEVAAWEKTAYCQSGAGVIMDAWSGSHNEAQYRTEIDVVPGTYMLSFWCWRYGTDAVPVIRPNLYWAETGTDIYFDQYAFEPVENTPTRYEIELDVEYTGKAMLRFVTMTPWTGGEVYFTDVKLERGNTATAWSPYAEEFRAGTSVQLTADEFRVTTPRAVFEILSDEGESTVTRLDKDGITAEGEIIAPNLAYRYNGPGTVVIKPDAAGEEIAAGGVYRSLKEALAAMSNKNLPHDVVIDVQGDSYGLAELAGLCGSAHGLTINGNGYSLIGSFRAANCMTRIVVNGLTFAWSDVGGRTYTADFDNCADVEMTGCTVNGSGGAQTGLYLEWATRAAVKGCEFYNVLDSLMIAGNNVDMIVDGAKGDGPYFIWTDGANVKWRGTRPGGAWWKTLPSLIATDTGTTDLETLTVDDGTGTVLPDVPAVTTGEFEMVHSDSYSRYLKWDWVYTTHPTDDDDIMQGYTETVSRVYGCMWFDLSAISGRTVNQAMLRLHRMGGYGGSRAVEVHLYGTATAYDGRGSAAPEATADYGVIGSVSPNETAMLTIPVQAATDLMNGTIQALMLYTGESETYNGGLVSRNYARFAGETSGDEATRPMLTVTYQ